jgi:hypothetical protein
MCDTNMVRCTGQTGPMIDLDNGPWLLKYDDERASRRWTAVGPTGRLGDVGTAEEAIRLLRDAGAPATTPFLDIRASVELAPLLPNPVLRAVVVDTTDARATAEFYRELLGYSYRPGDAAPAIGETDPRGEDWLVLVDGAGQQRMSFQHVDQLTRTTWPDPAVPMQLHVDLTVSNSDEMHENYRRALELGATLLMDRTNDPEEPLYVLADPAGHPFCLFVG